MAIKSYYRQKLAKGKIVAEYDEEEGYITITKKRGEWGTCINSIYIDPKDFETIKELVENLDVIKEIK